MVYLDDYKVEDAASKGLEHCFSITTPSRVWYMQADRQIDMDIWMECLRNALPWYGAVAVISVTMLSEILFNFLYLLTNIHSGMWTTQRTSVSWKR